MRRWLLLIMSALLAAFPALAAPPAPAQRILFVGNSLTYYGNLPATFAALARANGHDLHSEMIVEGGATLSQRLADGSVQQALRERGPAILVLQERGGDLLCHPEAESCESSRQALAALSQAARDVGAHVVVLGSYQPLEPVSIELVARERDAAQQAAAGYIEISESLRRLSGQLPDLSWYAADGMHPGPALTLLNALQLHRTLYGAAADQPLRVNAPIYGANTGLEATLRRADAPAPRAGAPDHIVYTQAQVARINAALDADPR